MEPPAPPTGALAGVALPSYERVSFSRQFLVVCTVPLEPPVTSTTFEVGDISGGQKKWGKLLISLRYDRLPLLPSGPEGFSRSWTYKTCPGQR